MVALAPLRFAQLLLAAGAIVGCQSGPSISTRACTVVAGQRTTIHLLQVNDNLALSLQNASANEAADIYTQSSADQSRKVATDAEVQALLDVFSDKGMFAASLPDVPSDARVVLLVEQGKQRWYWARRKLGVQASDETFNEARAYFLSLYNGSVAYHGTGKQRPDFTGENARARAEAETARLRLEKARLQEQGRKR